MSEKKPEVIPAVQVAPAAIPSAEFQAAVDAAVKAAVAKAIADLPAAAPASSAVTEKLLQAVLARDKREEDEEQARLKKISDKQALAGKNSQVSEAEKREKQRRCRHLKGGKLQRPGMSDFNVGMHTFVDGERVISCYSCGMKWKQKDTKEYLLRDGKRYRNHTGLSFHDAFVMLQGSTNTESKSEIVMTLDPDNGRIVSGDAVNQIHEKRQAEAELFGKPVEDKDMEISQEA